MSEKHSIAGLGGTFDHFHLGHRHFLDFAASQANEIWVGVTTNSMTHAKNWAASIESFEIRKHNVEHYLENRGIPFKTFPLENAYGPTLENSSVTCLVVTEHSVSGGEHILQERQKRGLAALPMQVCTLLRDSSGKILSSTRIRAGEINRDGETMANIAKNQTISAATRSWLQTPQGKLLDLSTFSPLAKTFPVIVVGDIVLDTFLKKQWHVDVGFFDGLSQRQPFTADWQKNASTSMTEPAGTISAEGCSWLRNYLDRWPGPIASPTLVQVAGEEDLLAVSTILTAPLGSMLYYGQPNQGIVEVEISEKLKNEFARKFAQLQNLAEGVVDLQQHQK